MPTRRKFIATALPLAATGALCAAQPAEKPLNVDGVESAARKEEVKKSVLFAQSWHEASLELPDEFPIRDVAKRWPRVPED
jgi:hypothetical protein